MHFFGTVTLSHVFMYLFPALVFAILLGLLLGYSHLRSDGAEESKSRITKRHPEGIEERNAPFPLGMILIILATVLWGFCYILFTGIYGVVI